MRGGNGLFEEPAALEREHVQSGVGEFLGE